MAIRAPSSLEPGKSSPRNIVDANSFLVLLAGAQAASPAVGRLPPRPGTRRSCPQVPNGARSAAFPPPPHHAHAVGEAKVV